MSMIRPVFESSEIIYRHSATNPPTSHIEVLLFQKMGLFAFFCFLRMRVYHSYISNFLKEMILNHLLKLFYSTIRSAYLFLKRKSISHVLKVSGLHVECYMT